MGTADVTMTARATRAALLLAATFALAPGLAAREIAWNSARRLTWDDFEGRVSRNAEPENVALTAATLSWTYEYEVRHSADACTYRITAIRSAAVFDTNQSWVRPGHRNEHVLDHEQGHFDITQIHKLVLDEAVQNLVGATGECRGRSLRRASADAEAEIAGRIGPIYDRVWANHARTQRAYDAETRHGLDAEAQRRWLDVIAAGLQGRRWHELGAEHLAGD